MKNLNLTCPINKLGYGVAGHNIAGSLAGKYNLSLFTLGHVEFNSNSYLGEIEQARTNTVIPGYDPKAPSIRLYHQFDLSHHVGHGPHIGFPIFELDQFSPIELTHMRNQDILFLCSTWAKEIVDRYVQIPTYVVPLGVDTSIFNPRPVSSETTNFFNMGKWEIRKGHDLLIEVFQSAFSHKDNVHLYLCCDNPLYTEQENKEWERLYRALGERVTLLPRLNSHYEIADVMNRMDCGIFLSRGEGWNLEALEMMACNKPVIATGYSAHLDFCDPNYLVNIDRVEPAFDGKWFFGQGNWAHIGDQQKEQAVAHLRKVHQLKQSGQLHCENNKIASHMTWEHSANTIMRILNEIA